MTTMAKADFFKRAMASRTPVRRGLLLLLAALTGCATVSAPGRRARPEGISIEVHNQTRNAVTIYVWSETYQNRLGMVEAVNDGTFSFRWNLAGPVYFMMDFLAQGCTLSEPIYVDDGDDLILTVQPIDHRRASRAACGRRPLADPRPGQGVASGASS